MNNSPTALYFKANDLLDQALEQTPRKSRRIGMLQYAVGILLTEAQETLAKREQTVDEKVRNLFQSVAYAFGAQHVAR
jgi:DNA-directed RNA polymerase specialized sigma24 family protein